MDLWKGAQGAQKWYEIDGMTEGTWKHEPDVVLWQDQTTGYWCLIRRHDHHWTLNGYVGLPEAHALYRVSHMNLEDGIDYIEVHGGITFTDTWDLPYLDDQQKKLWWIGFDCGHAWDRMPGMEHRELSQGFPPIPEQSTVYRDIRYVKEQCEHLALQLKARET